MHAIGSRHLYTGTHWRSLGQAKLEQYELVTSCEVLRVTFSRNYPTVPRYVVRFENGNESYAYDVQLTPL